MNLMAALVAVALVASGDAIHLRVIAAHAGASSKGLWWQIIIEGGRVSVSTSDIARNVAFDITDAQRRQLVALLDETDFFSLRPQYGVVATELKSCRMAVSLGDHKSTVSVYVQSKRKPPNETEVLELQRAYRVWDALKTLGRLADLPDDCRSQLNISESPPR
jgi:hypothetical protein